MGDIPVPPSVWMAQPGAPGVPPPGQVHDVYSDRCFSGVPECLMPLNN